jgi:hypothetical protein
MFRLEEARYTPAERECREQFLEKYLATVYDKLSPYLEEGSYTKLSLDHKRLESEFRLNGSNVCLLLTLTLPENIKLKHRNVGVTLSRKRGDHIPKKVSEWTNELPSGTLTRIIRTVFSMLFESYF